MRVGFIGLGRMGKPMSYNLLKAGFTLTVHNKSRAKVGELARAGAIGASSPAEVAQRSDIVLACLPTVATTEEVFLGNEGVMAACRPGQILVDHSTIGPGTARKIAAAAQERGAHFLDAPISGGIEKAEDATLTIMVGGDPDAYQQAEPVFHAMGQNVCRVGDVGVGCVVKLVNQLLTSVHAAVAAEAMVMGAKAGADPQVMYDILVTSWGYSRMLERSVPRFLKRDFSPKAPLRLMRKDLEIIWELTQELSLPLRLVQAVREIFGEAHSLGLEESDVASLVLPLEKVAGVQVVSPERLISLQASRRSPEKML